jgi:malate dehydrogenase (oxaloacetate-decarboxylating)
VSAETLPTHTLPAIAEPAAATPAAAEFSPTVSRAGGVPDDAVDAPQVQGGLVQASQVPESMPGDALATARSRAAEFSAAGGPDPQDPVFALHLGGKLEVVARTPLRDRRDLALAYTPGVADVSMAIARNRGLVDVYTGRGNTVAVISDGTAVLGLGNIGPEAAMPVMEGKAMLFKHFADLDAVPICLNTTDVDELVDTIARMAPTFGGINLEDISAPRCFEVERRLQERLDLPVFHDDQHGTAVVALAALRNAALVVGKEMSGLRVVISGAGAAGVAIAQILRLAGVRDVVVCDSIGIVESRRQDLVAHKELLAATTNPRGLSGGIAEAMDGADVYIGVSGGSVPEPVVASMAPDSIVFALANPTPEVHPDIAAKYAAVSGTGRSDYPNQINNVLAFPGIFRGALDVRASRISEGMKLAAATAIAAAIEHPTPGQVIPSVFDERVVVAVSHAVAAQARAEGLARA